MNTLKRVWRQARATDLARHGSVLFVALTIANLSNYLFHVVISRLLSPAEYGAFGAVLSGFVIISVPAGALQTVVAKRVSIIRATTDAATLSGVLRSLLRASIATGIIGAVVLGAASPLIAQFLRLQSAVPALILSVYLFFAAVATVVRGVLQGRLQFKWLASVTAGSTIIRLVSGVLFVSLDWGVSGAVAASLAAELVVVSLGIVPLRQLLREKIRRTPLHGLLKEARLALLTFTGFWGVVSIDTVLVRHFFPTEVSGFYAAAAVAAHAVLFLPGAIAIVAFPKFAETGGQSVEARRTLFHSIVGVGLMGLGASALLWLFGPLVVRVMFGAKYLAGTPVLGVLGFAMALLGIAQVLLYFHLASNSKALFSVIPAFLVEALGIALFHESIVQVALVVGGVSIGFLAFNLLAAYAQPGDPKVQPATAGDLWNSPGGEIDLTIVTPAFNPGTALRKNLERLLTVVKDFGLSYEVIAVSDGSTDQSHEHLDGLDDSSFRLIHYEVNRGKGYALRMGLANAKGNYVCFIDVDGDIPPAEIKNFITLMNTYDVDLVVGSKRHPLSHVSYPWLRRAMSWIYHVIVRVLFGIKLSDTQTGLKLAKRQVLAQVLPRMLEKRFAFDLELIVVARLLGFRRVLEAPVRLDYQFSTTVSWRTAVATAIDTAAIFYRRYILRYYHHAPVSDLASDGKVEEILPPELAELR